MPEDSRASSPSVVMLTADRQIDRRIFLEADTLEEAGWCVTIVAMPAENGNDRDDPRVVRIGQGPCSAVRENVVLKAYGVVRNLIPMNGMLMRALKALTWRFVVDQEKYFQKLYEETACRYRPDVFMAHDLPMLAVARQAAEAAGARLVYDSHELFSEQEFTPWEKRRWAEIEAKHIGSCQAVITINRSIANELERRYNIHGVNVIQNADRTQSLPEKTNVFHKAFGLEANRKILLFQGGLSAARNLKTLVGAMRHVKNPSVDLVFLGDGQLTGALKRKVRACGLSGRVHFHEAVPQNVLASYTAAADAGIVPYKATCLNNLYCTPNKLFEFIASGLPILASDLPEIRRLVETHGIGLLFEMETEKQMARAIDAFFEDEKRLAAWRGNVLKAQKTLCWEREGEKLSKIFEAFK